jgi:ribosomal protein S18 acetylase RimI-like enzyme
MRRFAGDGLDHAALEVDGANATGAFRLYERLGFVEVDKTVDLMKELDRSR